MELSPQLLFSAFLIVGFFIWRTLAFRRTRARLPELLRNGAVIVDVRSRAEFRAGSNPRSVNIPLDALEAGARSLDRDKPVILCCASGARSGRAAAVMKGLGFRETVNAGSWVNTLESRQTPG